MNVESPSQSARFASEIASHDVALSDIDGAITAAKTALLALQREDGHFVFELEADATIPAEYVLMRHYLAEPVDDGLEAKIANYLRRIQSEDGGWPLFHDGTSNISASVKAYFALKMIGVGTEEPYMKKARGWILSQGGASHSNVFTRNLLALFGAVPWTGVPVMPVEIMVLPRWFPFHIDKISYWARTVLIPLTVLNALKPKARNPKGIGIPELFTIPPDEVKVWPKGPH
ncbi:MAG: prenyltransferase/squalene oxidase repeat-containing protein, partial [Hyphomicrobium sp.]